MISKEQQLFFDYINSINEYTEFTSGEHILRLKKSDRPIYYNNEVSKIASVWDTDIDNVSMMVVDKNFFRLKPDTQKFVIGHELAHMTTGISTPDSYLEDMQFIAETKVDLATGLPQETIIDSLNDLKNVAGERYEHSFSTRISNIEYDKVSIPTEGVLSKSFYDQIGNNAFISQSSNMGSSISGNIEQQIKQAQNNPLYHTVYDITKNIDSIDGAREAIKQFGIDNNVDVSQLSEFFNSNEFAFFNGDIKVPNMNSFSNVQFGLQSKVAKTEQVGFDLDGASDNHIPNINESEQLSLNLDNPDHMYSEQLNFNDELDKQEQIVKWKDAKQQRKQEKREKRQKAQEVQAQEEAVKQAQYQKQAEKKTKTESKSNNKKSTYQSKNTGGRKQRRQNRNNNSDIPEPNTPDVTVTEQSKVNATKEREATEKMYSEMYNQIEATEKNNERARILKEAASKGREQIATNNVLDSIMPIIDDATDLETAQSKIAEWAKKSGLDKENRMEMRSFVHDNWEDISKKQKVKLIEKQGVKKAAQEGIEELGESNLRKIFNARVGWTAFNVISSISDYKDAREEGKGVIGSVAKAGVMFAAGEVLGGAMLPVMLAKSAPQIAVNTIEGAQRMTRQMNSVQRIQTFGEAEFMDTQQLATMRQAGMELAKMSQYNLQQSMMGNEAQYMHRI